MVFSKKNIQKLNTMDYDLRAIVEKMWKNRKDNVFSGLTSSYKGLSVKASIGIGNKAMIPWISFCADGQKTSQGIYPVLLFYCSPEFTKNNKNKTSVKKIVLAFGISADSRPLVQWGHFVDNRDTIGDAFIRWGYSPQKKLANKYNDSFVFSEYDYVEGLNYDKVQKDIDEIIDMYSEALKGGGSLQDSLKPTTKKPAPTSAGSKARVWIYAPGEQAKLWDDCYENGLLRLGWDELGNYEQFDSQQAIFAKMKDVYGVENKTNIALAFWQFLNDMQIGDIVYAKKGTFHIIGRGVVEGDYVYDDNCDEYKNTRRIRWTEKGDWEAPYRLPQKTLTRLSVNAPEIELLKKTVEGTLKKEIPSESFSIKKMIGYIKETGLLYTDSIVKRFAFSLMSKRFLILSGLAGSGKTQLALAFASALVKNKEEQMCVVSVGADWTNREPLLGFPNALQQGKYVKPESGVLDLLIEANRSENAEKPFFLILDEMNMSYVERYFADFLSAMESKEKICLWNIDSDEDFNGDIDGVPQCIDLPENLFIIGTINVDETTYMFSPKVLDRANVIEFKISRDEMNSFLKEMREIDREGIISKAAGMGADFVKKARKKDLYKNEGAVDTLQNFFDELKNVNAEFGYRSATEIFRFICQAKANDDSESKMTDEEILDAAIVQKLLPKLHGSRKKLEPVLTKLWRLCFDGPNKDLNIAKENIEKAQFKDSADKICRMYESATANGFTSFAEA